MPGTGDYVQGMITGIEHKLSIEPNYNNGPYVSNARNLASNEFKTKIPKIVLSLDSPILYGDDR